MKWIAVRNLTTDKASGSRKIEVSIGTPKRVGPDNWRCPTKVSIAGVGDVKHTFHDTDAFNSLLNAITHIRRRLEELHCEFSWLGGVPEAGFGNGFPYFLSPGFYDADFDKKIERLVEKEMEKELKKLMNMTKAEKLAHSKKMDKIFNTPKRKI